MFQLRDNIDIEGRNDPRKRRAEVRKKIQVNTIYKQDLQTGTTIVDDFNRKYDSTILFTIIFLILCVSL